MSGCRTSARSRSSACRCRRRGTLPTGDALRPWISITASAAGTARAELHWPELDLTLVIEAGPIFRHLVIYVPPGQDFFCIEPVSHVNDGFNMLERGVEGTGVRVLAPGQTLAGTIRLRIV